MSTRIAVALLGLFLSGRLLGRPLPWLISNADTIVVGTESAPAQSGHTVTFQLSVERVLTGDLKSGETVSVGWNGRRGDAVAPGSPSYRGIWFLRKAPGGNWECLPALSSGNAEFFPELSLPVSDLPLPPQLAYDAATTPLADQIVLEATAGRPRANPRALLGVVGGMSSPGSLQAFRYLAGSQSQDQAILGLIGLMEAGDTGGLLSAETLVGGVTAGAPAVSVVASAVQFFRSSDPVAVASLGRMATSSQVPPSMQKAAASALAAIHSAAAVPWLGVLLDNSSTEMQIYGARGLSYFANGVGIPTPQTMPGLDHLNQRQPTNYRTPETDRHIGYRTGESEPFIQFWKNWWGQHPELQTPVAPQ